MDSPNSQNHNPHIGAAAALLAEARLVGYRPCFARAFGGAACAVLLSQFWFWTQTPTGQRTERGGWFWKSQREITEETGLTRAETETARRKLRDLGVLQEDLRGIPGTLHFRVDVEALIQRLQPCLPPPAPPANLPAAPGPQPVAQPAPQFARNQQTSLRKSRKLPCGNPANLFARTPQTISETPSQIFHKNIRSQARPDLPAAGDRKPEKKPPVVVALTPQQCRVNQQGTARFKDALRQAVRNAARSPDCRAEPTNCRAGPSG